MANRATSKAAVARRVWARMFDFLMRSAPERTASLGRRGLTPNDSRALASLGRAEGRTMRSLAEQWQCDASYATQIVDRLERLGLAERRSVPYDRRVKLVVLTDEGARTKAELWDEFHTPPSALLDLDRADLEALDRAVAKLAAPAAGPDDDSAGGSGDDPGDGRSDGPAARGAPRRRPRARRPRE